MSQVARFMGWSCPVYPPAFKNTGLQFSNKTTFPPEICRLCPLMMMTCLKKYMHVPKAVDAREKSLQENVY